MMVLKFKVAAVAAISLLSLSLKPHRLQPVDSGRMVAVVPSLCSQRPPMHLAGAGPRAMGSATVAMVVAIRRATMVVMAALMRRSTPVAMMAAMMVGMRRATTAAMVVVSIVVAFTVAPPIEDIVVVSIMGPPIEDIVAV